MSSEGLFGTDFGNSYWKPNAAAQETVRRGYAFQTLQQNNSWNDFLEAGNQNYLNLQAQDRMKQEGFKNSMLFGSTAAADAMREQKLDNDWYRGYKQAKWAKDAYIARQQQDQVLFGSIGNGIALGAAYGTLGRIRANYYQSLSNDASEPAVYGEY